MASPIIMKASLSCLKDVRGGFRFVKGIEELDHIKPDLGHYYTAPMLTWRLELS